MPSCDLCWLGHVLACTWTTCGRAHCLASLGSRATGTASSNRLVVVAQQSSCPVLDLVAAQAQLARSLSSSHPQRTTSAGSGGPSAVVGTRFGLIVVRETATVAVTLHRLCFGRSCWTRQSGADSLLTSCGVAHAAVAVAAG